MVEKHIFYNGVPHSFITDNFWLGTHFYDRQNTHTHTHTHTPTNTHTHTPTHTHTHTHSPTHPPTYTIGWSDFYFFDRTEDGKGQI